MNLGAAGPRQRAVRWRGLWAGAALLVGSLAPAGAQGPAVRPLVMAVDNATEMPMARIQGNRVLEGMTLELGQLLARPLQREPRFVAVPRRRLAEALLRGEADLVCGYLPAWLPGPLRWSQPFFQQSEWLLTRADVPAPQRLADLRGQPIGTILGFVYPELSEALGGGFVREDAPNAAANLRKLAAGRMNHASASSRVLRHMQKEGLFQAALHPPLVVASYTTQCALSPSSPVGVEALNQAIDRLERDGSLRALYQRYD